MLPEELVRRFTLPLLKPKGDRVISVGSALLLRVNRRYYLVTAGHVGLESNDISVLTGLKPDSTVFGALHVLATIDCAIVEILNPTPILDSGFYEFLDEAQILRTHNVNLDDSHLSYMVVGYPWKKTRRQWQSDEVRSTPFGLLTRPLPKTDALYEEFNEHFDILLQYHRKRVISNRTGHFQIPPELEGMSGCGLWYHSPDTFGLVGMLKERAPKENSRALVATHIDAILEGIRLCYDDKLAQSEKLFVQISEQSTL